MSRRKSLERPIKAVLVEGIAGVLQGSFEAELFVQGDKYSWYMSLRSDSALLC